MQSLESIPAAPVELITPPVVKAARQERIRVDGKFFARGHERVRIHGVTYGPFAPNEHGACFPSPQRMRTDFELMAAASVNAVRVYHMPPPALIEMAGEHDLSLLIDLPWQKQECFLDSAQAQRDARESVRKAVEASREFKNIFAFSIGNEISPNIVRWHGARRVERFLGELADVVRQANPQALATYANFPPTEYLDLSFADFATFNVYLHDRQAFRNYLRRLQNLAGEKPLLLGELGMDTLRHGEVAQAEFLAGHLHDATLLGLAGAFVFSWTDDWHTDGWQIDNWAFGVTDRGRSPKASYYTLRDAFESTPANCLTTTPKVSVVVCTYNGGATLTQCLHSLQKIDYPDYEVIVVDDGSTDNTSEILPRFPDVRAIVQENRGLSVARNVGMYEARGSIVAYTDSDCFVDPDWLSLLVAQLQMSGAAAVGGPNFTPDDGWLASCVAASPGQPTHILETDQVAEHIPGCNMAFQRQALLEINGFDAQYRKAGDDVDVCWRLQHAGYWITFAPGAFVWHHRRQTPRAFLRQQSGYGEAEALLGFQHPDKFNARGDGKWNGVIYGGIHQGLCLDRPLIYHGTFATGLFQTIYQPRATHWAMLPSSLEWHVLAVLCALGALLWPLAGLVALGMWMLSLAVAGLQAYQAKIPARYDGLGSRLIVMGLCYLQPLVRAWKRQRGRFFAPHRPQVEAAPPAAPAVRLPLLGESTAIYWSEKGIDRLRLLKAVIQQLNEQRWTKTTDAGWEAWDLEVYCHPWAFLRLMTADEQHVERKRLIRVKYSVRPSGYANLAWFAAAFFATLGLVSWQWPLLALAGVVLLLCGLITWRGARRADAVAALVDSMAQSLEMIRCEPKPNQRAE